MYNGNFWGTLYTCPHGAFKCMNGMQHTCLFTLFVHVQRTNTYVVKAQHCMWVYASQILYVIYEKT